MKRTSHRKAAYTTGLAVLSILNDVYTSDGAQARAAGVSPWIYSRIKRGFVVDIKPEVRKKLADFYHCHPDFPTLKISKDSIRLPLMPYITRREVI